MSSPTGPTPVIPSLFYKTRTQLARSVLTRFELLLLLVPSGAMAKVPRLNSKFELAVTLPDQPTLSQSTQVIVQCQITPAGDLQNSWLGVSFLDHHQHDIEQRIRSLTHDDQQHYGKLFSEIFNQHWSPNVR